MPNARQRQRYNYSDWYRHLECSTKKNLEYCDDYYKYLRGMLVIRDLEDYERYFMGAYDHVVLGVK